MRCSLLSALLLKSQPITGILLINGTERSALLDDESISPPSKSVWPSLI